MSERISGSETEAFTGKLNPILEQMNASKIPDEHQPTVLFSLTQPSSKARSVLKKCNLQNISIDNMVDHLKEECLYDPNIQDRRANRWNSVTYKEFQAKFSSEDEATRACIEHITLFHKDLPKHLNNDAQLRDRLRNIFKGISWCSTLFEKPISQYSPSSFGSMIITAAANADDRSRNRRNGNEAQPTVHHLFEDQSPNTYNDLFQKQFSSLIAFFAKTPPPHRSRRPFQFQRRQNYINNRTYGNNPGLRTNRRPYFPSSNMNNR